MYLQMANILDRLSDDNYIDGKELDGNAIQWLWHASNALFNISENELLMRFFMTLSRTTICKSESNLE